MLASSSSFERCHLSVLLGVPCCRPGVRAMRRRNVAATPRARTLRRHSPGHVGRDREIEAVQQEGRDIDDGEIARVTRPGGSQDRSR